MMAQVNTHLLVFGDQVIDKRPMIRRLVRNSKSSPMARRFLQEATDLVQIELAKVSPEEHGWSNSFESLLEVAESHASYEASDTARFFITSLLALVGRLGDLIVRAERDPTILGSRDRPIHVLALCAGQVPAAVAIAAHDSSELFTLAQEIILISFRWMRATHYVRQAMISPDQIGGWCVTFPGLQPKRVQAILDDFHRALKIPTLHRVAIGVVSKTWLTLVGPASSLRRLAEFSRELRQAPQVSSDAGVPAHAPFMANVNIDEALGNSHVLDRIIDWSKVTMVTPNGACKPRRSYTLRQLLHDIFDDILMKVLPIDDTIQSSIAQIDQKTRVSVHEVGDTSHIPLVLKTLAAVGLSYDVIPTYHPIPPVTSLTRGSSDIIAVVGMSGRFPGSDNVAEFWNELLAGARHVKKVPASRFDVDRYFDAAQKLKNSTAVKEGAWINNPGMFDNQFFNISPREAMQMDPVQRLCLTVAHEALEMAGYAPNATLSMNPERVATFMGHTGNEWPEILHQQGSDIYYVTSGSEAFISGKINYHYKFGRGAYTLDSVCASSTTAITLACKSLLSRDCDMAVAGGGSVLSSPHDFSGLSRSGMLSSNGGCRTFHNDADGYVRGEGIGIVILKRLEEALADGDNVLGVISGSARTYSTTSSSITHPSHKSQEKIYREVLGQTALNPEEIVYVEMHGTGTQAGDFEELTSVVNVMGGKRLTDNPLTVGAVKAAMGHGEGVAGVTALIKALMMLKHRTIPAQPGVPFKINERFPVLEERNVRIALRSSPLQASPRTSDGRIRMLVNTFDASGGNCSLVVEEAPKKNFTSPVKGGDTRLHQVVAVSARTVGSLQQNCKNLLHYLEENPAISLSDLAYSTTARRMHATLRKAFVCNSIQDLIVKLRQPLVKANKKNNRPRIVFVFTGQSSQYQAMGMSLYETSTRFRGLIDTYQLTASHHGLPDFVPIISGIMDISKASTTQVQLALIALELGLAYILRSWGIAPDAVIGHSLGEFAALCVAGVLSPSDTLYLVGHRALLMEQFLTPTTHAMLAVPMNAHALEVCISQEQENGRLSSCAIACLNAPESTVASGTVQDLYILEQILANKGTRATMLNVPYSFHSQQIEPVLSNFEHIAAGIVFKKPAIPVASALLGQLVDVDGVFTPAYLTRQARDPVNFVGALDAMKAAGFTSAQTLWIETGPDAVCLSMVRKTFKSDPASLLPMLRPQKDVWETVTGILGITYERGLPVNWRAYHDEFSGCLTLLSDLPTYAWDYKNYWTPYINPPTWEVEKALSIAKDGIGTTSEHVRSPVNGFTATMSLHTLVKEDLDISAGFVKAIFLTETSAPILRKAIQGHVVSGHAVMPLAVFCDMALTSARYCYLRLSRGSTLSVMQMTIHDMVISRAVTLTTSSSPSILTTAELSTEPEFIDISFRLAGGKDASIFMIGKCRVAFNDNTAKIEPSGTDHAQTLFLVKARMQQLRHLAASGKIHSLLRPVVYRLFSGYVCCSPEYRSLDEVIISVDSQDALATLTAPSAIGLGSDCVQNPFVADGVNQLTGFLLNNSLRSEDDQVIYVSEGFSESHQLESFVPGRKYTTYASGHDLDESGSLVNVTSYVFDGLDERLVAIARGVRFVRIKKNALDHILSSSQFPAEISATNHSAPAASSEKKSFQDDTFVDSKSTDNSKFNAIVSASRKQIKEEAGWLTDNEGRSLRASMVNQALAVVAAEIGVDPRDVTDETNFVDLGVDSLMAMTILSLIRSKVGLDLPPLFFMEYDTVGSAKQALLLHIQANGISHEGDSSTTISSNSSTRQNSPTRSRIKIRSEDADVLDWSDEESGEIEDEQVAEKNAEIDSLACTAHSPIVRMNYRPNEPAEEEGELSIKNVDQHTDRGISMIEATLAPCKINQLQDPEDMCQSRDAKPSVFFLANETGSSASYVRLPRLDEYGVYGVDWPTTDGDGILESSRLLARLADAIAASIIAHPASPPYILGGLSFGAVLAVEVARRLRPTKEIAGVLLLDPSLRSDDLVRTKNRLAKSRLLRPIQGRRIDAAVRAVSGHDFQSSSSEDIGSAVVVLYDDAEKHEKCKKWLSGATIKVVNGPPADDFLRSPRLSSSVLSIYFGLLSTK